MRHRRDERGIHFVELLCHGYVCSAVDGDRAIPDAVWPRDWERTKRNDVRGVASFARTCVHVTKVRPDQRAWPA